MVDKLNDILQDIFGQITYIIYNYLKINGGEVGIDYFNSHFFPFEQEIRAAWSNLTQHAEQTNK